MLESYYEERKVPSYNTVDFYPYLARNGKPDLGDAFNTFTGFPLERVDLEEVIKFEDSRL